MNNTTHYVLSLLDNSYQAVPSGVTNFIISPAANPAQFEAPDKFQKNPDIVLKNIEFPKAEEMANEIINKIEYFKDLYNVEK